MKTETIEINGFKIVLPIGLERKVETKVRDAYFDFLKDSTRDVVRHLTCLTTLLPPELYPKQPGLLKVLHAFGGLGASAQVISQVIGGVEHTFWERDPVCIEYLRSNYPFHTVFHLQDSFKPLATEDLSVYDVLLLDMSVGTIKTRGVKPMWYNVAKAVTENPDIVIWFTDTACHKMHLNHKSYMGDFCLSEPFEPTAEAYLNAYSAWLEKEHGLVITASMREAGEYYSIVKIFFAGNKRFQSIPYV